MGSIRKSVYASLLALTTLNFAPTLASAQEAHGSFTLTHAVSWQNVTVPAGEYRFSLDAQPFSILILSKLDGMRTGFVIAVPDTGTIEGSGPSRLLIATDAGGSYVKTMQLPEFGMTLNFRVPKRSEKQMTTAENTGLPPAQ